MFPMKKGIFANRHHSVSGISGELGLLLLWKHRGDSLNQLYFRHR